jgi:hypothetical protein
MSFLSGRIRHRAKSLRSYRSDLSRRNRGGSPAKALHGKSAFDPSRALDGLAFTLDSGRVGLT